MDTRIVVATYFLALTVAACAFDPSGYEETSSEGERVGQAEEALTAECTSGTPAKWRRSEYTYLSTGGKPYTYTVAKNAGGNVAVENRATDGSFWGVGVMNKWSHCPGAANESVVIDIALNSTGANPAPKTCTHVCLPDGREELHCPNGQFVMTRTARYYDCAGPAPLIPDYACTALCDAFYFLDEGVCDRAWAQAVRRCGDDLECLSPDSEAYEDCMEEAINGYENCVSYCPPVEGSGCQGYPCDWYCVSCVQMY